MMTHSKKAALAAFIGTTIEWYDFYIYALASVLIFDHLFFPSDNQLISILAAFGSFALGFLSRPLGAIIFGQIGDRLGRKKSLIITLILMGGATTAVGLLPTFASAGIIAPILLILLRIIQGIAVGGEWGGAVLLAGEHAPKGLKNFFSSFAQWGSPAGNVLALLMFSSLLKMPDSMLFDDQYWRIPFLLSFVLLIIGLIVRLTLTESPVFVAEDKKLKELKIKESAPIIDVIKKSFPLLILAIGANALSFSGIFSNTIMIGYVTLALHVEKSLILDALFWVAIVHFVVQPFTAYLSELFNIVTFLIIASLCALCSVFVLFPIIGLKTQMSFIIGISILVICYSAFYGVIAGYLSRIFPVRYRYTALSLSYQGSAAILGSIIPMLGGYLIYQYGEFWLPLAFLYSGLCFISIFCIYFLNKFTYYSE